MRDISQCPGRRGHAKRPLVVPRTESEGEGKVGTGGWGLKGERQGEREGRKIRRTRRGKEEIGRMEENVGRGVGKKKQKRKEKTRKRGKEGS